MCLGHLWKKITANFFGSLFRHPYYIWKPSGTFSQSVLQRRKVWIFRNGRLRISRNFGHNSRKCSSIRSDCCSAVTHCSKFWAYFLYQKGLFLREMAAMVDKAAQNLLQCVAFIGQQESSQSFGCFCDTHLLRSVIKLFKLGRLDNLRLTFGRLDHHNSRQSFWTRKPGT